LRGLCSFTETPCPAKVTGANYASRKSNARKNIDP
jgi:hypothetical protein